MNLRTCSACLRLCWLWVGLVLGLARSCSVELVDHRLWWLLNYMDGLTILGYELTQLVAILEKLGLIEDTHLVRRNLDLFMLGKLLT